MMLVVLALVGFVVAFGAIAVGANVFFHRCLQRSVVDRHTALDEIRRNGSVPRSWRRHSDGSGDDATTVSTKDLRRLSRLERYVEHTSLVESEEARRRTLDELAVVESEWRRRVSGGQSTDTE